MSKVNSQGSKELNYKIICSVVLGCWILFNRVKSNEMLDYSFHNFKVTRGRILQNFESFSHYQTSDSLGDKLITFRFQFYIIRKTCNDSNEHQTVEYSKQSFNKVPMRVLRRAPLLSFICMYVRYSWISHYISHRHFKS